MGNYGPDRSVPSETDAMSSQESSSAAVAEPEQTTQRGAKPDSKKPKPKRQPPYAVVLHNDALHTFDYVIEMLQKVFGYTLPKAMLLTNQVHYSGRAIVWSGTLEGAELKRDLIRGYGPDYFASPPVKFPLGVTLEPLPGD